MKSAVVSAINFYQQYISVILRNTLGVRSSCRFSPTCSEFAKREIEKNGLFLGGRNFLVRFFKCQPFYKGGMV